jgi:hypothetical protein
MMEQAKMVLQQQQKEEKKQIIEEELEDEKESDNDDEDSGAEPTKQCSLLTKRLGLTCPSLRMIPRTRKIIVHCSGFQKI